MMGGEQGVIELAVSRAVEEALPLVPVEDKNSLLRVARHPHEDPLRPIRRYCPIRRYRPILRYRAAGRGDEGDLDRAVAVTRAMPGFRGGIDTEFGDRGLGGHGFLATPQ